MPGPPPKSPAQRRRRNVAAGARTLLPVHVGELKRPALGKRPEGFEAWVARWPKESRATTPRRVS